MTEYEFMSSAELASRLAERKAAHAASIKTMAEEYDGYTEIITELQRSPAHFTAELVVRSEDGKKVERYQPSEPFVAARAGAALSQLQARALSGDLLSRPGKKLNEAQAIRNNLERRIQREREAFHRENQRLEYALHKAREREAQQAAKLADVAPRAPYRAPTMLERLNASGDVT